MAASTNLDSPGPKSAPPGVDLSMKEIGLGSPPLRPFPLKRPPPTSPKSNSGTPVKKAKLNNVPRRKASRKLAFDEDKTSPVSGTIIRELAEGEEVPAIRKGNEKNGGFFCSFLTSKHS